MRTVKKPDPEKRDEVEQSLYNRMLKNAFFGFVKSAVIAAFIGLTVGGLIAAGMTVGILPSTIPFLSGEHLAFRAAAWFAGVAGSFGAVAGIQSTRDARRFFLMHEAQYLSPEETREPMLVLQPKMPAMDESRGYGEFQKKILAQEASSESLRRG
ncbi:MAG: hypothetical protein KGJ21_10210 [Pseudomonadota bacterium]|nr:hypothetical protein [Pseudomonadota bacterium]